MNPTMMIIFFVVLVGMMYFQVRTQKKQAEKRMESLNKLQKGYEVITIGGLYGTVDEVDSERKTVVLDVDGVFLTFELAAIKTVLPLTESIPAAAGVEGDIAVSDEDTAIEEQDTGQSRDCLFYFKDIL